MKKLKIILVDDHKVFRKGLKIVVEDYNFSKVVAEATTGDEFLEIMDNYEVDLVFMDINMPGLTGFETTKLALQKNKNLKIIAMSGNDDIVSVNEMLISGALGYLEKDVDYDEIHAAIRVVNEGKMFFSTKILVKLTQNAGKRIQQIKSKNDNYDLTKREAQVLELICKGFSDIQIAEKLNIVERTVEKHKANLYQKTDTQNALNLALFAFKNNLIQIENL